MTVKHYLFTGTTYPNCYTNTGVEKNIFDWLAEIKSEKYRKTVEEIRSYADSDETTANEIKVKKLPALLPAGFAPKGRSTGDPLFLSRVMMIDYDNHNHKWTVAARKKLLAAKIPGILGIHETPKSGMRVFVFLPECTTEDFTFFENVVFEVCDGLVKFKHDEQASTLMHLTSASYDPETWIADKESLQPFPIEEELCKAQHQLYAQEFNLDENGQEQNADDSCEQLDKDEQLLREIDEALMEASQGSADINHITSEQTITDLVDHFNAEIFAIAKGQRNDALVRLGSYMSYKGMYPSKMDFLISYVHNLIGCREYNPKRISQCLCWGFKHNKNHERVRSENGNMLNNIENEGDLVSFFGFDTCVTLPKSTKIGSTGPIEPIFLKCQSVKVPLGAFLTHKISPTRKKRKTSAFHTIKWSIKVARFYQTSCMKSYLR